MNDKKKYLTRHKLEETLKILKFLLTVKDEEIINSSIESLIDSFEEELLKKD